MYMRSSIAAQSCASVPPEPAWMSTKQLFGSSGLENMRRNSSPATCFSSSATSAATPATVASSLSARAISNNSRASRSPEAIEASPLTVESRDFFSLPSCCARCWLLHTAASPSSVSTSLRRLRLPSKSKIPPQLLGPLVQVGEREVDLVEAFGVHDRSYFTGFGVYSSAILSSKKLVGFGAAMKRR